MRTAGYVLLEILIGTAIASLLTVMLFISTNQIRNGIARTYEKISFNERAMLFFRQWEHDLSGVFIPRVYKVQEENPQDTLKQTPNASKTSPQKKQILVPLENAFMLKSGDVGFALLSMITNNPLPTYGTPHPRMARVIYKLEGDVANKGSYHLTRQEFASLEPNNNTQPTSQEFLLIDGIKELRVEFIAQIPEQTSKEASVEQKPPTYKEVVVTEWPAKELEKEKGLLLPNICTIKLVLWDTLQQRDLIFTYRIPFIVADQFEEPKKEDVQQTPTQSKEQKNTKPEVVKNPSGTPSTGKQNLLGGKK